VHPVYQAPDGLEVQATCFAGRPESGAEEM